MSDNVSGRLVNIVTPRTATMLFVIFVTFFGLFLFFVFYESWARAIWALSEVAPALIGIAALFGWIVWAEFTHVVQWDEEAIYFRPQCEPWELPRRPIARMKFEDMLKIGAPQSRNFGGSSRYQPGAVIEISGLSDPPNKYDNAIQVRFDNFKRDSILDLMRQIYRKRPELVPPGWVRQIAV
ncbi:hypothetical protein V6U71_04490 [Sphingopyxis sp. J-6]|uniref:hypothetical protein n=1 Tax=Sphingopyxis sp. J-6 TaxID=3122054 RepID=UPI003983E58A